MEAGLRGRIMTHDLPRNDADNGEPPFQVARQYRRDDGFNDEEVATMTDREILALYRQKRKNPYLTLSTAKALYGLELKFGYLRVDVVWRGDEINTLTT
jgi:hypothetical protein